MENSKSYAGLDFGTSNCLIGVNKNGSTKLVELEDGTPLLPSIIYAEKVHLSNSEIDDQEFKNRVNEEILNLQRDYRKKLKETNISDREIQVKAEAYNRDIRRDNSKIKQIEKLVQSAMIREAEQEKHEKYLGQSIKESIDYGAKLLFGNQAMRTHLDDPEAGNIIKSPKSFLGADIKSYFIDFFSTVTEEMIRHIKAAAEQAEGTDLTQVVIGRPINFHGSRGDQGNRQAVKILEKSASNAGFQEINFIMEPIAAALNFEKTLQSEKVVLVLDVGGGTTDCSMIKLGPMYKDLINRDHTILACTGDRIGGTDLDVKLNMRKFMNLFGKGSITNYGLPIPNHIFYSFAATNNFDEQQKAYSIKMLDEIENYQRIAKNKKSIARLKKLHEDRLNDRLSYSAEKAKIGLSDSNDFLVNLDYVEKKLSLRVSRDDFENSIGKELNGFISLMKEAQSQAGISPDIIYVTGGTAKSPVIRSHIMKSFPNIEIVIGDEFGSVASGVTEWAHKIYR